MEVLVVNGTTARGLSDALAMAAGAVGLPVTIRLGAGLVFEGPLVIDAGFACSELLLEGGAGAALKGSAGGAPVLTVQGGAPPVKLKALDVNGSLDVRNGTLAIEGCVVAAGPSAPLAAVYEPSNATNTSGRRLDAAPRLAGPQQRALTLSGGAVDVRGTTFEGHAGGAILVEDGKLELRDSTLRKNRAETGAALYVKGGQVWVSSTTLVDNEATSSGGAIRLSGGELDLANRTVLLGNTAPEGSGSAILDDGAIAYKYHLPAPLGRWVFVPSGEMAMTGEGAVETDFPFDCAPGVLGRTYLPAEQSGPQCSGPCPAGYACAAATKQPTPCPVGTYCQTGSPAPVDCPPGTWGAEPMLETIDACQTTPAGFWSSRGTTVACAAGQYNPDAGATNASACIDCPLHTTTNRSGATAASDCVCDSGRAAVPAPWQDGAEECGCPAGSRYSVGLEACVECSFGLTSPPGATRCEYCAPGFVVLNLSLAPGTDDWACQPCLRTTVCNLTLAAGVQVGGNMTTLTMKPGYWRLTEWTTDIRACDGGACLGNSTVGTCGSGLDGPMCQLCPADGSYYDNGVCRDCPDAALRFAYVLAVVLAASVALVALYLISQTPPDTQSRVRRELLPVTRALHGARHYVRALGLPAKLKIAIAFYQVIAVLDTTYSVRIPPDLTGWVDAIKLSGFEWESLVMPSGCLANGFISRLFITALAPIGAMALVAAVSLMVQARNYWGSGRPVSSVVARGMLTATPYVLLITFVFVPSVSATVFSVWSCDEFGAVDRLAVTSQTGGQARAYGVQYMRKDLAVQCDGNEYDSDVAVAVAFMVVWPIGVTVLYAVLLLTVRARLLKRDFTPLSRATGFLHRDYKPDYYYWEMVELTRRIVLTGWVALIPESHAFIRLVVGVLVSLAVLILVLVHRPLKTAEDQAIASASHALLVVIFVGASYIKAYSDTDELFASLGLPAAAPEIFGFGSSSELVVTLLCFAAGMLVILACTLFVLLRREAREGTVRLASTRKPPDLTLAKGMRYHLFLSHVWSTGQDAAATIKRQLQRLVHESRVFLDVDDLQDIGKLEKYIDQSAVVLMFLSIGYLSSRNWCGPPRNRQPPHERHARRHAKRDAAVTQSSHKAPRPRDATTLTTLTTFTHTAASACMQPARDRRGD